MGNKLKNVPVVNRHEFIMKQNIMMKKKRPVVTVTVSMYPHLH